MVFHGRPLDGRTRTARVRTSRHHSEETHTGGQQSVPMPAHYGIYRTPMSGSRMMRFSAAFNIATIGASTPGGATMPSQPVTS